MNPIRRELINGLLVLVVASLLSVAFSAFQVNFNAQLWALILIGIAVAVSGYIMFEMGIGYMTSTERREAASAEETRRREEEWLKRVGTPARLLGIQEGISQTLRTLSPGSDYTVMYYYGPEGGAKSLLGMGPQAFRENVVRRLEEVKQGKIREYKRIICFDHDVLANDQGLRSGALRVGKGPGTINPEMGEHCREMMKTKGCSLYVAPAVFRSTVVFYGVSKVSITVEAAEPDTGGRTTAGAIFFCDPPNGEIVEQFRQMERETERRMVAVHKIIFPEGEPGAVAATR